jgi:GDP-L-fucose synthase
MSQGDIMNKSSKIYLAGHTDLVVSAILKKLKESGYTNLIVRTIAELDLKNSIATEEF